MSKSIGIRTLSPFLVIFAFFLYKLTHLGVSFFWDESWVYAPALQTMAEVGPSLLPDAIPLDYSRGHPLFFHFLGGIWIKIFGTSFFSMHFYALLISLFFLVVVNELLQEIKKGWLSFWVLLILCVQPMLVAQASMVLPEVLLAALSTCCLLFYIKKRTILYIIAGVLTILTKETGILVIGSIVVYHLLYALQNRIGWRKSFTELTLLSLPLLTLIGHMIYLKFSFGWYLYPEHTGMIKSDLYSVISSFFHVIHDQVFFQYRWLITVPFILVYSIKLINSNKFANIILLLGTAIVGGYAYFFHADHFPISLIFTVYAIHIGVGQFKKRDENGRYLLLLLLFIFIYALFAAANFYTVRYLLSTVALVLTVPLYYLIVECSWRKYFRYYLSLLIPIYIYILLTPSKINDVNLTYLSYCPLQEEVVRYFEANDWYDEQINTMFLMSVALSDFKAGYRTTDESFRYINTENSKDVDYYIFYNVEEDSRREGLNALLLKRWEKNHVWFEAWKVEHSKKN